MLGFANPNPTAAPMGRPMTTTDSASRPRSPETNSLAQRSSESWCQPSLHLRGSGIVTKGVRRTIRRTTRAKPDSGGNEASVVPKRERDINFLINRLLKHVWPTLSRKPDAEMARLPWGAQTLLRSPL